IAVDRPSRRKTSNGAASVRRRLFRLVGGYVLLCKSLEIGASQSDLNRLIECLVFRPALLDDSIDHPERADSIRAAAMDQHWLVCRVLYCSDELVRLLRFWRAPYDRDADILHAGFFAELLFAFEVESFTWISQIEYGAISVCGKLAISGL